MPDLSPRLSQRFALLRLRLATPDADPVRVWGRRRWRSLAALAAGCVAIVLFDAWLASCGFEGCPSRSEIRAFRPGEGGRIVDRDDRFLGRIALVRRVNVPLASIPSYVREAFLATQRAALMAQKVNMTVTGVIENMSWFSCDHGERYELFGAGGGQELADQLEVPLLGRVPLMSELRAGGDDGHPIVVANPDCEASQVFRSIAHKIAVELAPKRIYRPELKII